MMARAADAGLTAYMLSDSEREALNSAHDTLTRELCRLREAERVASLEQDIPSFVHARLRWCELVLTLCPGLSAGAPKLARKLAAIFPAPAAKVPQWKREVLARPLVPILRRKVRTVILQSGASYKTALETLACGHTHHVLVMLLTDEKARRRRCHACGTARLAAFELEAIRKAHNLALPAPSGTGKCTRKGGRGESPEPSARTKQGSSARVFLPPRIQ